MNDHPQKFIFLLRKLRELSAAAGIPKILSRLLRSLVKRLVRYGPSRVNGFTFSVYGVWLCDNWEDATFRFCATGAYGFYYADWLQNVDQCTFIDIGANVGLYSLLAGRNPNIRQIYAFEPQPEIFKLLNINLEKNQVERATVFSHAISDITEESDLQIKEGHSGAATLRDNTVSEKTFVRRIRISKVDHAFLDENIKIEPAEKICLKIDTEGHEEPVLLELMKTRFWKNVSNIFYEVDERYINQERILNMLSKEGFSIIYKNGEKPHYDLMLER